VTAARLADREHAASAALRYAGALLAGEEVTP
jgi:hypothetical protein